jgi:predicted dienelactone hydrolase
MALAPIPLVAASAPVGVASTSYDWVDAALLRRLGGEE